MSIVILRTLVLLMGLGVTGLAQSDPPLMTCVVIVDVNAAADWRSGPACSTRLSPASTFKIPHALIALETGVVTDSTIEKWDGSPHPSQPIWDRDHTVLSAMRPSVLWFFQRIAPRIGAERARAWLQKFEYGNADASGPIQEYWINGRLRISPDEQVRFLRRFYAGGLPVAATHMAGIRSALEQKPGTVENARGVHTVHAHWPSNASLNSKTGATMLAGGENVSWLVGQLTIDHKGYVFASAAWRNRGGVDNLAGAHAAVRVFKERGLLK
jgi:beta-lactamase class D